MSLILEFFEPSTEWWICCRNILLVGVSSLVFIWLLAFILARTRIFANKDAMLRVYFAWMTAFTLHALLITIFLLAVAMRHKVYEVSLGYCLPYLLLVFMSGYLGLKLNAKIQERLNKIKEK
jgi:hypothetical protein